MCPMNRPHDALPCEEALDLLEPYLDADLPPGEMDRVRRHLEACSACAAELSLAARIQRELRALPQPDCPPEVIERVRRAGRGEVVPFPARERAPRWRSISSTCGSSRSRSPRPPGKRVSRWPISAR